MSEPKSHIHLILPKDEHELLKRAAEAECRSIQGEIQHRLRKSFGKRTESSLAGCKATAQ
jgi:hypothetical protein